MSRPNRYNWSEKKIDAFFRQGRGAGAGPEYQPWLNVTDVPSIGVSSQPYFDRIGRRLQLLSDLESAAFLRFWWDGAVTDVREQFPLPRGATREIATSLGVRHPKYPRTSRDVAMTTDMLVTRSCDGAEHFSAFSIKSSEDASRPRTIEKLEIERLYWEQAGVDWSILSEEMLPQVETLNLSWVFGADDTLWNDQADNRSVLSRFANAFAAAPDEQAAAICVLLDKDSKRGAGKHLSVLRAAIKKRLVSIDLRGSLVPQACCNEFAFQLEH